MQTIRANSETATDARLTAFLSARCETEREFETARLLAEHAEPVARQIIRKKLRGEVNAEDVWQEIAIRLLIRLGELRLTSDAAPIANFQSYAAVTSYRVCADFLRRKYPLRFSLRNKIRYLLTHDGQFDFWETETETFVCGLRGWQFRFRRVEQNENYRRLLENPCETLQKTFPNQNFVNKNLPDVARAIFDYVNCPIELDDLTAIIAAAQGIKDQVPETRVQEDFETAKFEIADENPNILDELTGREYVKKLWSEIQGLPVRQRAALLLNLRDGEGGNALEIFLLTNSATPAELARALEMSETEFARVWRELPFDDLRIAAFLGATRQQVINLRKCAKEKLGRRLK